MHPMIRSTVRSRVLSSRLGSLLLLFQRTPLVQMLFPEARILSGAGLGEITTWTIATIAGLGAYDSVAGATTLTQLQPNAGTNTVPTAKGANLAFVFQIVGTESAPKSWQIVGALPAGLTHTNSTGSTIDSITGVASETGSFPITIKAWEDANNSGNVFSKSFTITVAAAIITSHPVSTLILSGDTATLSVSAGSGATYQWYQGNSPNTGNLLNNKTSATFTTPALTSTTRYWVRVVKNGLVSDSDTAIVTVGTPPATTTQPVSKIINSGSTATLTVAFSGTAPSIQWYRGAAGVTTSPVSGASSASFTTPALTANTSYWARATNELGTADSNAAIITIRIPPAITTQPASVSIGSGSTATFSITASGTSPTFQWYVGNTGVITNPVSGATGSTFTTPALAATTTYWVRASNVASGVTATADSNAATATVTQASPFTLWQNNRFTAEDLADPLVSGPDADPDGDGLTNNEEYIFGLFPLAGDLSQSPAASLTGNQLSMSFTARSASGPGYSGLTRHYTLESAGVLDAVSWTPVAGYSDITGAGQTVTYTAPASGPRTFYRLSVRLMP